MDVAFGGGVHGERALHHCIESSSLSLSTVCVCGHVNVCCCCACTQAMMHCCCCQSIVAARGQTKGAVCDGWLQTHMLQRCRIWLPPKQALVNVIGGTASNPMPLLCCICLCCAVLQSVVGNKTMCAQNNTHKSRGCVRVCTPFCLLVM